MRLAASLRLRSDLQDHGRRTTSGRISVATGTIPVIPHIVAILLLFSMAFATFIALRFLLLHRHHHTLVPGVQSTLLRVIRGSTAAIIGGIIIPIARYVHWSLSVVDARLRGYCVSSTEARRPLTFGAADIAVCLSLRQCSKSSRVYARLTKSKRAYSRLVSDTSVCAIDGIQLQVVPPLLRQRVHRRRVRLHSPTAGLAGTICSFRVVPLH